MMDSRYDFINLFGKTRLVFEKRLLKSNFYSGIKHAFDIVFLTGNKPCDELQENGMFFFKSRLKKSMFSGEELSEYVVVPGFNNPRWVIKNSKDIIDDHGLLIKPSSALASIIWRVAVFFNYFNLFNFVFPDRFVVKRGLLERNMFDESVDDFEIEMIYTGAPGPYQKFTCKVYNKKRSSIHFFKLGINEKSIERIESESNALKILNDRRFENIVTPKLADDIKSFKFQGILLENITCQSDLQVNHLTSADIKVIAEIYEKMGLKEMVSAEYIHVNSLDEDSQPPFPKGLLDRSIYLGFSHGDYIPWNRFIGEKSVKIIDWEMAKYRPLLYDLFAFIIISGTTIEKRTAESIVNECVEKSFDLLNLLNMRLPPDVVLTYLFFSVLELSQHYKNNGANSLDRNAIEGLSKITEVVNKALSNDR